MKIFACISISLIAHCLLLLMSAPEELQFNGGSEAQIVSLNIKIQQVANNDKPNRNSEMSELDAPILSNSSLFDGNKNKLNEHENVKQDTVNPNAVKPPKLVAEKSIEQLPEPLEPLKEVEQALPIDRAPIPTESKLDQSKEVLSSAPVIAQQDSANDDPVTLASPPIFKSPRPSLKYPIRAKRRGQQGVTILSIELDNQGHIVAVNVIKSSGFKVLDTAALNHVKLWEFHAVEQQGRKIKARFTVPIAFSLNS